MRATHVHLNTVSGRTRHLPRLVMTPVVALAVIIMTDAPSAQAQTFDNGGFEQQLSARERLCIRLERQLVAENQRRTNGREALPGLRAERRVAARDFRRAELRLERGNCYDQFLFSRTLRRSRRCLKLGRELNGSERRLQAIEREIDAIRSSRRGDGGRRRARLMRELARNGCGEVYQQQARRQRPRSRGFDPFGALFGRDTGGGFFGNGDNNDFYDNAPRDLRPETGIIADATYRTMCVRLCDGYYFPVSYQTLPSRFGVDQNACSQRCAAPADLYVYRNPGGEVEQMISTRGLPYTELETAFKYRKQVIEGCSCSQALYDPEKVALQAELEAQGGTAEAQPKPKLEDYVNPHGPGPVTPPSDVPVPSETGASEGAGQTTQAPAATLGNQGQTTTTGSETRVAKTTNSTE